MRTTALGLAVLALAFAPAPFPRPGKYKQEDDLAKLQGDWLRVSYKGQAEPRPLTLRISGNRMQYVPWDTAWVVKLDTTKRPRRIDIIRQGDPTEFYRGVYRLDGDRFTYLIQNNVSEANRPLDFASPGKGAWVAVFERKKP
jgi:uncharacterized protein (TIGR03067 family)